MKKSCVVSSVDCAEHNTPYVVRCEAWQALACGLARGNVGTSKSYSLEKAMGQETAVHQEVHDHHTMQSAPGAHNGVGIARPMPGSTPAGALPELTTE